ncbi:hypothetical protein [Streptomyces sp. NPDC014006]|uniref:hypothetical protein n=1 Tax=Streptomyces sp. NPDC014006 TaxID=3364870 RepID=UPI0036FCD5AA
MRLIPDDPFPEIGHPYITAVSADGRWLAVSCHATDGADHGRVAVYRTADLALWDQFRLREGVELIAFHPRLPVLAVGTEAGDEFERRGGLYLYEPGTRRRTGMTVAGAGVVHLRWRDARRLEVLFAEPVVDFADPGRTTHTRATVVRDDWSGVRAEDLAAPLGWPRGEMVVDWSRMEGPEIRHPQQYLAALAAEHGRAWNRRSGVALVESLRDGRVLAALQTGTLLECWSPEGTLLWSVPEPEESFHRNGGHLYVSPDEESAWVTVRYGDSSNPTTFLRRLSLADGSQLAEQKLDFPVALAWRADGAWVARDSRDIFPGPRWPPYDSVVYTPSGRRLAQVPLGESDRSFGLRVRRSPHLLVLRGYGEEGTRTEHLDKWVVRLSPAGVERLFPLSWDGTPGASPHAGPAVYVDDAAGPGLVHACTVRRDDHLVRRAFPGGDPLWVHRFGTRVTDVDVHDGHLHAVTGERELLTLRATDGTVVRRTPLTLDGHTYTPTCLTAAEDGRVVIGTVEGRLLTAPGRP